MYFHISMSIVHQDISFLTFKYFLHVFSHSNVKGLKDMNGKFEPNVMNAAQCVYRLIKMDLSHGRVPAGPVYH